MPEPEQTHLDQEGSITTDEVDLDFQEKVLNLFGITSSVYYNRYDVPRETKIELIEVIKQTVEKLSAALPKEQAITLPSSDTTDPEAS